MGGTANMLFTAESLRPIMMTAMAPVVHAAQADSLNPD